MQTIERVWNMPTFFEDQIENDARFENTLIVDFGRLIIDKDFIDEMHLIASQIQNNSKFIKTIFDINAKVKSFFYSEEVNVLSRAKTYSNNQVYDENGAVIGTKLSSLKGKNVAQCSEKSIAAYIILKELYETGKIDRKPILALSQMTTEKNQNGPHAFVLLDKECNDPTKHLLFDIENPTLLLDKNNKTENLSLGLYSLTDEEYDNLKNGLSCTPKSLFEILGNYEEINEKRTYGKVELDKQK